jgi:hypothetical protein
MAEQNVLISRLGNTTDDQKYFLCVIHAENVEVLSKISLSPCQGCP